MHAYSVLHVILPLSDVLVPIWEEHRALALFFAGLEVALVHAAVLETQFPFPFEQVLSELALVRPLGLGEVVDTCIK